MTGARGRAEHVAVSALKQEAACRANADVMAKFFGLSRSPRWGRFSQKSDSM
jgi:hypothetical protein